MTLKALRNAEVRGSTAKTVSLQVKSQVKKIVTGSQHGRPMGHECPVALDQDLPVSEPGPPAPIVCLRGAVSSSIQRIAGPVKVKSPSLPETASPGHPKFKLVESPTLR